MRDADVPERNDRWMRTSVVSLVVLTVLLVLVGFVWLPSVHGDFSAQGLWSAHLPRRRGCRAHGASTPRRSPRRLRRSVVLEREMTRVGDRRCDRTRRDASH